MHPLTVSYNLVAAQSQLDLNTTTTQHTRAPNKPF
jgi:hypothetical protein